MTDKQEEDRALLEREASFLLRESGFDPGGQPIPGKLAEERRRGAAIKLGKTPTHFENSPRDE